MLKERAASLEGLCPSQDAIKFIARTDLPNTFDIDETSLSDFLLWECDP